MKVKSISSLTAFSLLLTQVLFGQGHFSPRNFEPPFVNAPVLDAQGVPLPGTNYLAEIWGAATPDSLTPLVQILYGNSREIIPFFGGGYFYGSGAGLLSVTTIPPRGWAWLQVRAWDSRLGATYEEVFARGIGGYGESPRFYAQSGDPFDQFPVAAPLTGLQSFSLRPVVPEPSAALLLLLGLPWLFFRSRRNK